jgi:hypothetical protein
VTILTEEAAARKFITDFPLFCETFVWIKTKQGKMVRFKLNKHQWKLWKQIEQAMLEDRPIRIIVLKARQLGFSTMMQAFLFWLAIVRPGTGSLVMAHKEDSAGELFGKIELMYDSLPDEMREEMERIKDTSKKGKKLAWSSPLNSSIYVDTALNKKAGRSQTFQCAHLSEVAFYDYPTEIMYGMLQALPKKGFSLCVVESTANGMGTYFHTLWERSQDSGSMWEGMFFPWNEEDDYQMTPPADFKLDNDEKRIAVKYDLSDAQMCWRRAVIWDECEGDEDLFRQEYPLTPAEAFIVSGNPYYGQKHIEWYTNHTRKPIRMGRVEYIDFKPKFIDEDATKSYDPPWWVWKRPVPGRAYAIGADIAGGTATDNSAAHVIDLQTLEVVATYRAKLDPDEFAYQLKWMGITYNWALIAPERNGEGRATLLKLVKDLQYPRVFYHQFEEDWSGGLQQRYGWVTSSKTRPTMLAQAGELIRTRKLKLWCERTVSELASFVRVDTSKIAEGATGCRDDMVMSLCIASSQEVRQLGHVFVDFGMDQTGVLT